MRFSEIMAGINGLTKPQIDEVLYEWDQISRERFLEIHNVHPAQKYWIRRGDKKYDAKAIVVRAFRNLHWPLGANVYVDWKRN